MLDDDSVAPKQKIKEAVELIREEQRKIAQIQAQAQQMQQRANMFLMEDVDAQAQQMADMQMMQNMPVEGEEEYEVIEDNPDEN